MIGLYVASSLAVAEGHARVDLGWERIGRELFRTPDGREFRYAYDLKSGENLHGHPMGTPVYLGPGAERRMDYDKIRELIYIGKLEEVR